MEENEVVLSDVHLNDCHTAADKLSENATGTYNSTEVYLFLGYCCAIGIFRH